MSEDPRDSESKLQFKANGVPMTRPHCSAYSQLPIVPRFCGLGCSPLFKHSEFVATLQMPHAPSTRACTSWPFQLGPPSLTLPLLLITHFFFSLGVSLWIFLKSFPPAVMPVGTYACISSELDAILRWGLPQCHQIPFPVTASSAWWATGKYQTEYTC